MKYYLYVSDTKVDMMYAQIPKRTRDRIATELKIDLKILSASFTEEALEETRFSRLKVVVEYIEKHLDVGTVDEPSTYFKDTLPMRWGSPFDAQKELVYFGGYTEKTILGLGGSMKHVIGVKIESIQPFSTLPGLSATLQAMIPDELVVSCAMGPSVEDSVDATLTVAAYATNEMQSSRFGPNQRLEFLARKLLEGQLIDNPILWAHKRPGTLTRVLLGTPIYVALAD